MVTRPAGSAQTHWLEQLRELGAEVIVQPAIRIGPPADWRPVDDALARLDQFDWLVFSSVNGVRFSVGPAAGKRRFAAASGGEIGGDRAGHGRGIGAISAQGRLGAGAVSRRSAGRGVGDERRGASDFCWPGPAAAARSWPNNSRPPAPWWSRSSSIPAPTWKKPTRTWPRCSAAGQIDWVTVTSSAIARSLAKLFGEQLRRAKLASISPLTSGVLRELGYQPAVEAAEYTMPGLAAAIARAS